MLRVLGGSYHGEWIHENDVDKSSDGSMEMEEQNEGLFELVLISFIFFSQKKKEQKIKKEKENVKRNERRKK